MCLHKNIIESDKMRGKCFVCGNEAEEGEIVCNKKGCQHTLRAFENYGKEKKREDGIIKT